MGYYDTYSLTRMVETTNDIDSIYRKARDLAEGEQWEELEAGYDMAWTVGWDEAIDEIGGFLGYTPSWATGEDVE